MTFHARGTSIPTTSRLFLTVILSLPCLSWALDIPPLTGRVIDLAHVLSGSEKASLESQLTAHETKTSNQVVVLTLSSLEGQPLEEFSHRVASTWHLGQKGTDNGALLLVALKERKIRIEVGYGLEGTLTDARSSRIIRHDMVPHFRNGDYGGGISAGVQAILQSIEGSYVADEKTAKTESLFSLSTFHNFFIAIVIGTLVGLLAGNWRIWSGGLVGSVLALLICLPIGLALSVIAAVVTSFLITVFSRVGNGGSGGNWMGHNIGWGPGPWHHGGGFGGGGFSGGGFSGGGGGFGGGGASGGW